MYACRENIRVRTHRSTRAVTWRSRPSVTLFDKQKCDMMATTVQYVKTESVLQLQRKSIVRQSEFSVASQRDSYSTESTDLDFSPKSIGLYSIQRYRTMSQIVVILRGISSAKQ
jgi:hypothetical protein